MLREIKNIEQTKSEKYRRWFQGEKLDLVVWYKDQSTKVVELCEISFEDGLCLRLGGAYGVEFFHVDDGGENPLKNRSPLLFEDSLKSEEEKFQLFELALEDSQGLDQNIIHFMKEKILES
jgi:hypothetical protein